MEIMNEEYMKADSSLRRENNLKYKSAILLIWRLCVYQLI